MKCLLCHYRRVLPTQLYQVLLQKREPVPICESCQAQFVLCAQTNCCLSCCGEVTTNRRPCTDCDYFYNQTGTKWNHTALYRYNEAMQNYFWRYKKQGDYKLAECFQTILTVQIEKWYQFHFAKSPVFIVSIPPQPQRYQERGFDPVTSLVDQRLLRLTPLLKWQQHATWHQSTLTLARRYQQPQLFEVDPLSTPNKTPLLLVDDIVTSGQTLINAVKALRQAGYLGDLATLSLVR